MNPKGTVWIVVFCYGGAAILAGLATLEFVMAAQQIATPWALVVGGGLLLLAGGRSLAAVRSQSELAERQRARADRVESDLALQRTAVDTLADGLDVAIFVCDSKANVLYANRRAREIFRFDSPIGRSILAVTLSYDLEQLVSATYQSQAPQSAELTFSYPDERVGLVRAWPSPEGLDRVFLSVYEITDLRRLERIRQDFVGNVSHELRTPLTIIRAMSETLLDEETPDPATYRRYLTKIVSEVDRLSTISNDLLILSAAESNVVRKQSCDLADVFRQVTQELFWKAEEKGLKLTFEGPEDLQIEANPAQMTQVALNLVDNALNYTPEGQVWVRVREDDGEAVAEVQDTGVGISSEHVQRIFERFYRVDKGRSRSTGGTGLGLSIVKHIVEAHGGRVVVDSALNVGSTFRVTLPIS